MRKRIVTTLAVVALVAMSAFAIAAPKGGRGPVADPALTPEKQAAVAKIVDKHHAKLIDLREKIWAKHTELQALSRAGKAEKSDIQNLIAEISKLRASMNEEREAMRSEIEKETGIKGYGRGYHRGGMGGGFGGGDCPGGACGN